MDKMLVWFFFRFKGKNFTNGIPNLVDYDTLSDVDNQLRDFIDHLDQEVVEAYWINESNIRTYVRRDKT